MKFMGFKTFSEAYDYVKSKLPHLDLMFIPVCMWETVWAVCERDSCKTIAEFEYDYSFKDTLWGYGYKVIFK